MAAAATRPRRPRPPAPLRRFFDSIDRFDGLLRVLSAETEEPVPGVRLEVWWTLDEEPNRTTATVGPGGEDLVLMPHGARLVEIRAGPTARTAPARVARDTLLRGGQSELVELHVALGGSVRGQVVDELGRPLAEARVAGFHRDPAALDDELAPVPDSWARCDEEGRFHLGGFPPGPFVIEPVLDGQVGVRRAAGRMVDAEMLDGFELVCAPGHRVLGQVHDAAGAGIAAAQVVAGRPGRRQEVDPGPAPDTWYLAARSLHVTTDADGLFALPLVPDAETWNINARHPRHLRRVVQLAPGEVDVFVLLDAAAVLEGKVYGADGVAGGAAALVLLLDGQEQAAVSDRQGDFLFGELLPGAEAWLLAVAPGHAPHLRGPLTLASDAPPLTIRLEAGEVLAGVLRAVDGAPLADTPVVLEEATSPEPGFPEDRLPLRFLKRGEARTGGDGSFRWEELPRGSYRLTVLPPGRPPVIFEALAAGETALDLRLRD